MKQGCLWLLLFAAWSASAQPVYKCTNAEGGNSEASGNRVPEEIDIQRAREILDEIRRRLGTGGSPALERDYLERLLGIR